MNFAIIIQARTSSKRYPKKILAKIDGISILEFLIERLLEYFHKNKILIATTKLKKDNIICNISRKKQIKFFRGSENDVLKRYLDCAKKFKIKNIVRITSDCPLVDPKLIKNMMRVYFSNNLDYYANTCPPTQNKFPDGSDIEIFNFKSLLIISKLSKNKAEKEHVTPIFWNKSEKFKIKKVYKKKNISNYKFSLDYKSDLILIKTVLKEINKNKIHGTAEEIVEIIKKNRYIREISKRNRKKYFNNRNDLKS